MSLTVRQDGSLNLLPNARRRSQRSMWIVFRYRFSSSAGHFLSREQGGFLKNGSQVTSCPSHGSKIENLPINKQHLELLPLDMKGGRAILDAPMRWDDRTKRQRINVLDSQRASINIRYPRASSSTSTQCLTGMVVPVCKCPMQPMLAEMTALGSKADKCLSLRSRNW